MNFISIAVRFIILIYGDMIKYRFVRMKGGVGAYAGLTLERTDGPFGLVEWAPELATKKKYYDQSVRQGIEDALTWAGEPRSSACAFRILEFVELEVDTNRAAVRCAATIAAWKELGRDENQLAVILEDEWRVKPKA
jgi:hypothetical protein